MLGRKRYRDRRKPWPLLIFLLVLLSPTARAEAQGGKPFYEGKTLQFLVASGPGATTDISARLVARYLGKHIAGNPGIVVQNMSGGGGLVAANYLFNVAKPDGLTIAAISRANYIEQMVSRPEVKTDFRKLSWIGSFNKSPMMVACRSDTEYKSVAAMRAAKTPPRFGQSGTGSISFVFANLMERILDLKIKNVTGFQSGRETDLGLERGEVDCRATSDVTVIRAPWNRCSSKRGQAGLVFGFALGLKANLTFELSRQSSCKGEGTQLGGFQTGPTKCCGVGL